MGKKISGKNLSIALLVSVALMWINLPFIDGKMIGSLIVFFVAIYMLVK